MMTNKRGGPLAGLKVIEIAGIGPGPFCGMLLADLGASVLRIERPGQTTAVTDVVKRGRYPLALDLKGRDAISLCRNLATEAEVLFEGFRPGVMERLGLGPDALRSVNPRLVYGRLTGWGQTGPLAQAAGHDINYISITGLLSAIGPRSHPCPPLNVVGDYAGGGLYMALGIVSAVLRARRTGEGQVIDGAMSDGAASLAATFYGLHAGGTWTPDREANVLDGGSHFYGAYECADGKWISIAPMEEKFYSLFIHLMGLPKEIFQSRDHRSRWAEQKRFLQSLFATQDAAYWNRLLEGTDVCFAQVLTFADAPNHPHNRARGTFVSIAGVVQPAPAPRFSRSPTGVPHAPQPASANFNGVIEAWRSSSNAA